MKERNLDPHGGRLFPWLSSWKLRAGLMMVYDFLAMVVCWLLALLIRFDFLYSQIPPEYLRAYRVAIVPSAVVTVVVFVVFQLYRSLWQYASLEELVRCLEGSAAASLLHILVITLLFGRMPVSYYLAGTVFFTVAIVASRFFYRFVRYLRQKHPQKGHERHRILLIGAGEAGQMILKDLDKNPDMGSRVVAIIDDDSGKWGRLFGGVPVVGGRNEIPDAVKQYQADTIYLAIPSASGENKRAILDICSQTPCELKQLPGMYQLMSGQVSISAMKDVALEDLLGRDPIRPDMQDVFAFIHGKRVLVTGGGGSIGSELCRQIAAHDPEQLIIFDVYENNAYDIRQELKKEYPEMNLRVLIGSVRDSRRIYEVFDVYRPQVVYHAAAHKHVPLMEDSPCEAVKNNVLGTYKTAYAAMVHGCERFVLISTDKAVNPTNVMGASKRLCEMIIQCFDAKIKAGQADRLPQIFTHAGFESADKDGTGSVFADVKTEFVAVRFGNVLGSNGSVIPLFKKQIAAGGPVTVTDPNIIRYFMTIPEAVSLVMLAGTFANGGEIFVLDMGQPVKIDTLARNLIRQAGFVPGEDIEIVYTGLRPGEKLYEEKLMAEEGLQKTDNQLIHIGRPVAFDYDKFIVQLQALMDAAYDNEADIRSRLMDMVSTYHPADVARQAV